MLYKIHILVMSPGFHSVLLPSHISPTKKLGTFHKTHFQQEVASSGSYAGYEKTKKDGENPYYAVARNTHPWHAARKGVKHARNPLFSLLFCLSFPPSPTSLFSSLSSLSFFLFPPPSL